MPAALARRGITVLKDQRTRIVIRGDALEIAGIRFWTRRPADIASVLKGADDPVLLLAHDPRRLTEAAALNVPAVLVRSHARRPGRATRCRRGRPHALPHRRGAGPARELVDLRESGNRDGLRAGANQLPAGSGPRHTAAAVVDLITRRPSIRQPPSSTSAMASG